jgi:hypothetical protein
VRDAPGGQRIAQRPGDRILTDDRLERLRPPLSGKNLITHTERLNGRAEPPPRLTTRAEPPPRLTTRAEPSPRLTTRAEPLPSISGHPRFKPTSRSYTSDRAPTFERFVLRSPQEACSSQVLPRHTRGSPYRCSLPGLAGFGDSRCVGPNLQRRPLRLIQHGPPSEWEFNPAEADCGSQGTANSPSSTATSGGGGGI